MMSSSSRIPTLGATARVLGALSTEERDELLEALLIAICTNPEGAQEVLGSYIAEHDFQELVGRFDSHGSERG